MAPLFSIITPVLNCEAKIKATVESVLSEQDVNLEYLIMDAASSDNTLAIVKTCAERDSRLQYHSAPDQGPYDGMNRGINRATGKFIYFLGSGDRLRPNILSEIAAVCRLAAIDDPTMVYGNVFFEEIGALYDGPFDLWKLSERNICQQSIFYHRSIFEVLGLFDVKYRTHADHVFNLRCFSSSRIQVRYLPITIADYEGWGLSAGRTDHAFNREFPGLVRRYLGLLPALYRRRQLLNPRNFFRAVGRRITRSRP